MTTGEAREDGEAIDQLCIRHVVRIYSSGNHVKRWLQEIKSRIDMFYAFFTSDTVELSTTGFPAVHTVLQPPLILISLFDSPVVYAKDFVGTISPTSHQVK